MFIAQMSFSCWMRVLWHKSVLHVKRFDRIDSQSHIWHILGHEKQFFITTTESFDLTPPKSSARRNGMKAAIFHGPRDIRTEDIPAPELEDGDVMLRVRASGICGSDLHTYCHGMFEDLGVEAGQGRVMGHEFSGEVVEIRGEAQGVKIGDRVCALGMGANAEYYRIPALMTPVLLKIPDGISFEEAATTEPLATSLHAVNLVAPVEGETHVIMGAGIIGLGVLQILKTAHSVKTIVVDLSEKRLAMAKELGADVTINAGEEDAQEKVVQLTGTADISFMPVRSGLADTVYDCAGLPKTFNGTPVLEQALVMAKENGKVVMVAVYEKSAEIEYNLVVRKGITLLGSWAWSFDEMVQSSELIGTGKIDRKPLITHTFPLEDAKEGYETQLSAKDAVKVVLMP